MAARTLTMTERRALELRREAAFELRCRGELSALGALAFTVCPPSGLREVSEEAARFSGRKSRTFSPKTFREFLETERRGPES